jgi:uncharacterized protein (DUF1330 family)
MGSIEPTAEQLQAFLESGEDDTPVVMINLLRYREQASYPEGFDAEPCSGREAYQRYGAVATQRIASVGGRLVWLGSAQHTLIGPEAERWDDAVLVEYPSRKAFLSMVSQPEYQAAVPHRSAALEDSRLIATHTLADGFRA